MANRIPDEDLGLNVRFTFDWKANELADAGFQACASIMELILKDAEKQAKKNVEPGVGPGLHPHRTEHGFAWEDTGRLQDAIHMVMSGRRLASGKYVGKMEGRLEVDPITIPAYTDAGGYEHEERVVPYGAFLEMGFTPILPTGRAGGWAGVRSSGFFRYPFLAPAMYMATKNFTQRAGITIKQELQNREKALQKKKSIMERETVTAESGRRITRLGRTFIGAHDFSVQDVKDLDNP